MRFKMGLAVAAVLGLEFTLWASPSRASLIAYDSAGDSAYNSVGISGSLLGTNGGYGWGGPRQATGQRGSGARVYVGSSTQFGGGDINSPQVAEGRAWELGGRAFQGNNNAIIRPFSGPLAPGQTFSMDYANGPLLGHLGGGPFLGVILGDVGVLIGNGSTEWPEHSIDYEIASTAASTVDTGIRVTDQGIHIELEILDAAHAQFTITPLAPGGQSATVLMPSSAVSSVEIMNLNPEAADQPGDMFFNNIAITPEPSSGVVAALCAVGLLARR